MTSEGLGDFDHLGFDHAVRLFFPRPGQEKLRLPAASGNEWIPKFYLIPAAARPFVRNYTIRAHRPEAREVDIGLLVEGVQYPPSKAADGS